MDYETNILDEATVACRRRGGEPTDEQIDAARDALRVAWDAVPLGASLSARICAAQDAAYVALGVPVDRTDPRD